MATLGMILYFLSAVLGLVAWIWLIVKSFQGGGVVWGLVCIFGSFLLYIGAIVCIVKFWPSTKQPLMLAIASFVVGLAAVGLLMAGGGGIPTGVTP
ncbi:MAG: hypothetical protein AAF533_06565 [Acidobacteriota bacterium]